MNDVQPESRRSSLIDRILKVGTIAHSISVYVPAMFIQKTLGMARLVVLTHLVVREQIGIWSTGVVLFILGSSFLCLGANHAIARYVSVYEHRGQLPEFFRRVRLYVLALVLLMAGLVAACGEPILALLASAGVADELSLLQEQALAWSILANVVVMALYVTQLSFIYGLRAYRLASVMELVFSLLFSALALGWVLLSPTGLTLLQAHALAVLGVLLMGDRLLIRAVRQVNERTADPEEDISDVTALAENEDAVGVSLPLRSPEREGEVGIASNDFLRILRFGAVGMLGMLIWQGAMYVSYFMVLYAYGEVAAGGFWVIMQVSQPLTFLANAAWAVVFSHVARRWEHGDRAGAMFVLETSFKAIMMAIVTFTVLLYTTSGLWIQLLAPRYRYGIHYLSGLATFYLSISGLSMLTNLAKLHERPAVIALAAVTGAVLNGLLAALWMPAWGEVGAARGAGVGMFFGGGLVMLVYLLASGTRLQDSTYFVLATPVLLLLPTWLAGPLWAVLLPVCLLTDRVFNAHQKEILARSVQRGWVSLRKLVGHE